MKVVCYVKNICFPDYGYIKFFTESRVSQQDVDSKVSGYEELIKRFHNFQTEFWENNILKVLFATSNVFCFQA